MKTLCTCLSGKTLCDCQNLELIVTDRTYLNNRKDMTKEEILGGVIEDLKALKKTWIERAEQNETLNEMVFEGRIGQIQECIDIVISHNDSQSENELSPVEKCKYCNGTRIIKNPMAGEGCVTDCIYCISKNERMKAEMEKSRIEGVLTGLKICKEMWAQGTISHENIYENEILYKEELKSLTTP